MNSQLTGCGRRWARSRGAAAWLVPSGLSKDCAACTRRSSSVVSPSGRGASEALTGASGWQTPWVDASGARWRPAGPVREVERAGGGAREGRSGRWEGDGAARRRPSRLRRRLLHVGHHRRGVRVVIALRGARTTCAPFCRPSHAMSRATIDARPPPRSERRRRLQRRNPGVGGGEGRPEPSIVFSKRPCPRRAAARADVRAVERRWRPRARPASRAPPLLLRARDGCAPPSALDRAACPLLASAVRRATAASAWASVARTACSSDVAVRSWTSSARFSVVSCCSAWAPSHRLCRAACWASAAALLATARPRASSAAFAFSSVRIALRPSVRPPPHCALPRPGSVAALTRPVRRPAPLMPPSRCARGRGRRTTLATAGPRDRAVKKA